MDTVHTGAALRAYARFVATRPRRALALVVAVAVAGGVAARDVRLDNNFAALFATSSAEAQFREDYRQAFGPDDGLLAAVLTVDASAADGAEDDGSSGDDLSGEDDSSGGGLADDLDALVAVVDDVSRAVADVPGVARVDSPTVTELLAPGTGVPTPPFGSRSSLGASASDGAPTGDTATDTGTDGSERLALARASGLGTQFLMSDDGRTMLVVGTLDPALDSYEEVVGPAERFEAAVRDRVDRQQGGAVVRADMAGVAFTRVAAIDQMQSDLLALAPVATALMGLLLALFFRRVLAVVAPLVAMGLSLVATAGVVGLAGDDLNQVTVIYPVLLMGVVVASATHTIDRYYRARAGGAAPDEAARVTIERVLPGALVANLTTAIGFASLATGSMQILHEFGLYLASGVMLAWAIGTTAIPAILVLGRAEPPARYRDTGGFADGRARLASGGPANRTRTERIAWAITGRRAAPALLAGGLAVAVVSGLVASTATYDYALADMLPADDPTSVGNRLIDGDLAGIIPIEVSLLGPPGAFEDPDVVARAGQLDTFLTDELGARPTGLPALFDDLASADVPGADPPADTPAVALDQVAAIRPAALARLVTPDRAHARLGGFVPDHGGRWVVALRDRVEAEGDRLFAGTDVEVRVTGEAPVAYDGMNSLTRELVVSTIVALLFIVVAIGLAFRRVGLALVATLPNVVPVVGGMGLYALTSDTLDPLPGLVFCIAAGLAADDTIHLINRWKEERTLVPLGSDSRTALVTALVGARTAMVSSTLVLVAGFGSLALSGFGWNRELGLLGSVVLLLALVCDLILSPAALAVYGRWLDRRRDRHRTPTPGADEDLTAGDADLAVLTATATEHPAPAR